MSLHVLSAGLLTTVQDLGRSGHQHEGVTPGGAMDPVALRIANLLVGNAEGDAGLEITLAGPRLRVDAPSLVAIAGARLSPSIDGVPIPEWHSILVPAGAVISFGAAASGCRAYLAVAGGVDVPTVLGGRGTDLRARFGGVHGRALREGDVAPVGAQSALAARIAAGIAAGSAGAARWGVGPSMIPAYSRDPAVRVLLGAHAEAIGSAARAALGSEPFRIAADSDRMGYRLDGPQVESESFDAGVVASEPVVFGTIQVPPGGRPIVLMADRQTTGGYPVYAHVISVDLPLLAQLRPGDRLRFRETSLKEAHRLYLARERAIVRLRAAIAERVA